MSLKLAVRPFIAACAAAAMVAALAPSAAHAAPEPTYCNEERSEFDGVTIEGDLVVAASTKDFSLCNLRNTTVNGNVVVGEGAHLWFTAGAVRGDVIADSDVSVSISDSNVSGSFRQTAVAVKGVYITATEIGGSVENRSTSRAVEFVIQESQVRGDVRVSIAEDFASEPMFRGYDIIDSQIGGDVSIDGRQSPNSGVWLAKSRVGGTTMLRGLGRVKAGLSEPAHNNLVYGGNEFAGDVTVDDNGSVSFFRNKVGGALRGSGNREVNAQYNEAGGGAEGQFVGSTEPAPTECTGVLKDAEVKGDLEVLGENQCRLDNVKVSGDLRVVGDDANAELVNSSVVDGDVLVISGALVASDFEINGRLWMFGTGYLEERNLQDMTLARGSIGGGFDISGRWATISLDTVSIGAASELSGGVYNTDGGDLPAPILSSFAARRINSRSLLTIASATAYVAIDDSSLMGGLNNDSAGSFSLTKSRVSDLEVSYLDGLYYDSYEDRARVGGKGLGNRIFGDVLMNWNRGRITVTHNVISGKLGGEKNAESLANGLLTVENNSIRGGTWGDFA